MSEVLVASITPFWRYAVGPMDQPLTPAIPYWHRAEAEEFFSYVRRELPWAGVVIYRRRWLRGIEVVKSFAGERQ